MFSTRQTADRCVAELARHGLVCTEVRIEVVTDGGWTGSRVWAHSRWFGAADLVDRLYWQLQGDPAPEPVMRGAAASRRRSSRWPTTARGCGAARRTSRWSGGSPGCKGCSGRRRCWRPALQGGRSPRDRQQLSPWGERRPTPRNPRSALARQHPAARAGPGVRRAAARPWCWTPTAGRSAVSRPRPAHRRHRRWSAPTGSPPMPDRGLGRALADRRAVVGRVPGPPRRPVPGRRRRRQRLADGGRGRPVVDRGAI